MIVVLTRAAASQRSGSWGTGSCGSKGFLGKGEVFDDGVLSICAHPFLYLRPLPLFLEEVVDCQVRISFQVAPVGSAEFC